MSTKARASPDYQRLKTVLERDYGRKVTDEEAKGTGDFLINVYEVLLSDKIKPHDKIKSDTTNQKKETAT